MEIETIPFVDGYDRLHTLDTPHCVSNHSYSSVVPAPHFCHIGPYLKVFVSRSCSSICYLWQIGVRNVQMWESYEGTLGAAASHAFEHDIY